VRIDSCRTPLTPGTSRSHDFCSPTLGGPFEDFWHLDSLHSLIANPAVFELLLLVVGAVAGVIGAILGLGGGIVIIPVLTLLFGINIRYAVGASIVSVIATSSGAAATYVKDRITNIRVAMLLEVGTTIGAFAGAMLTTIISTDQLFLLFAVILLYSGVAMVRGRKPQDLGHEVRAPDPLATRLRLNASYPDALLQTEVAYQVYQVPLGLALMLGAGLISALLGIGSGVLKVPAMDQAMKLPIKVSSATSNFMMGVTAAASAGAYFMRGWILPSLAAPVAVGVVLGAWLGSWLMMRMSSARIRKYFVVVIIVVAAQMLLRGLNLKLG